MQLVMTTDNGLFENAHIIWIAVVDLLVGGIDISDDDDCPLGSYKPVGTHLQ